MTSKDSARDPYSSTGKRRILDASGNEVPDAESSPDLQRKLDSGEWREDTSAAQR